MYQRVDVLFRGGNESGSGRLNAFMFWKYAQPECDHFKRVKKLNQDVTHLLYE